MNLFKRLFKVGEAEANSAIDKMEDPIKMTEQGIRDMKVQLEESLEALAQVKALSIRSKNDKEVNKEKAEDYHNKAVLILRRAEKGELDSAEADRLAREALVKKEEAEQQMVRADEEVTKFADSITQLDKNIQNMKSNISNWENELRTLKARVKVSNATKNLNKQMAEIDSSSTVSMLERMKEKVAKEEALAEAYGEMIESSKSIDEEIDKAAGPVSAKADDELAKLKNQLGLNSKQE